MQKLPCEIQAVTHTYIPGPSNATILVGNKRLGAIAKNLGAEDAVALIGLGARVGSQGQRSSGMCSPKSTTVLISARRGDYDFRDLPDVSGQRPATPKRILGRPSFSCPTMPETPGLMASCFLFPLCPSCANAEDSSMSSTHSALSVDPHYQEGKCSRH